MPKPRRGTFRPARLTKSWMGKTSFAAAAVPAGLKAQHHYKHEGLQHYVHPETVPQ
jgi:hypothetical protein